MSNHVSPFLSVKIRGWSFPELCFEFLNGPAIITWKLLVFAIVFIISPLSALFVFLVHPFPFTYYLLLHWKGHWSDILVCSCLPHTLAEVNTVNPRKQKNAIESGRTARWVKWETKKYLKRRGNGIFKAVFNISFRYSNITKKWKPACSSNRLKKWKLKFLKHMCF